MAKKFFVAFRIDYSEKEFLDTLCAEYELSQSEVLRRALTLNHQIFKRLKEKESK